MANLARLASDDDNPAFMGARNPDDLCHVRFYNWPLKNNFMSEKEGRPVFDSVVFVEIHTPGNQLNIIQRPKYKNDENRFPRQWQFFTNSNSSDPAKQGTPLAQWPFLDVAKVEMLRAMKFFTVEQIAFSSDEQISHLGMLAGMAPTSFRDKAKAYLTVAKDSNAVAKAAEEVKARDEKIAELEAKLNALADRVASPEEAPKPSKKKYVMTEEHKAKMKAAREAAKAKHA